jgi:phage terminase large subunit-like protein
LNDKGMFQLTPKQQEANELLAGQANHLLLEGGSRSGKTFVFCRAVVIRALKARNTRHLIARFRFNACRESIFMDTLPKVFRDCFPTITAKLDKGDWLYRLPHSGSEIWAGGLDDKERTEKILGKEFATGYLNECSQISLYARNLLRTRVAQSVEMSLPGAEMLPLRHYYDWNPSSTQHWVHRLFHKKVDPDTGKPLMDSSLYQYLKMNPADNAANLPESYLRELQSLPGRLRRRFWEGEASDLSDHTLFSDADIDKWRVVDGALPDYQRIVVAVDPSGSGDVDNADNDAIGIVVAALGIDGNGYVLEDLTVKAGPATWGRIATDAYDRHGADTIIGEANYGGEMVRHVIQTARARTPYQAVTATRGKVVRAEPVSSLVETGKIRLVGFFPELEEELSGFTTSGYVGDGSPNRADAFVLAMTALFPGIVSGAKKEAKPVVLSPYSLDDYGNVSASNSWMGN